VPTPELRAELARLCVAADHAAASRDGGELAASVGAAISLAAEALTERMAAVTALAETDIERAASLWLELRGEIRPRRPSTT
jgi:hypothetical protein